MAVRRTKGRRQQRAPGRPAKDAPLRRNDVAEGIDLREVERRRALFLSHKRRIEQLRKEEETVRTDRRKAETTAKNDGFKPALFAVARNISKIRGEVTDRLIVAHWIGDPLGLQLGLFAKGMSGPEPRVDPYEAGKTAGMEGIAPRPPEHLAPDASGRWMEGYHDATAQRVREGIRPPEEAAVADAADAEMPSYAVPAPAAEAAVPSGDGAIPFDGPTGLDPSRPL